MKLILLIAFLLFVPACRSPQEIVEDSGKRYANYPNHRAAIYPNRHNGYRDHTATTR